MPSKAVSMLVVACTYHGVLQSEKSSRPGSVVGESAFHNPSKVAEVLRSKRVQGFHSRRGYLTVMWSGVK